MAASRKGCGKGVFALEDGRCLADASLIADVPERERKAENEGRVDADDACELHVDVW